MPRNYRLIVSITTVLSFSLGVFAQSEVEDKDVLLDGKPAKLNVITGKITLVKLENDKKVTPSITDKKETAENLSGLEVSDFYMVKEGETLLQIANRYNISLIELKNANRLETTLVDKGQMLRVRNFNNTESISDYRLVDEANHTVTHIVEKGQTLYGIARRYHIAVSELKRYNNLNSNVIKIGQKLLVSNFDTSVDNVYISVWTVSKGDTLYSIAKENGISVDTIKNLNGLTGNLIRVGQKLQLK